MEAGPELDLQGGGGIMRFTVQGHPHLSHNPQLSFWHWLPEMKKKKK